MATVVLPVLRSPMISSRWPRPTGVIASMALMPVWSGSCTGLRPTMPGRLHFETTRFGVRGDRALAVDRLTERVHDATDEGIADGHGEDAAGGLDRLALFDALGRAEHHRTDRVLVEVQRQPEETALELEELVDRGAGQARDAGDTVAHFEDPAELLLFERRRERLDVRAQCRGDLVCVDGQLRHESAFLIVAADGSASVLIVSSAMRQIVPLSCSSR